MNNIENKWQLPVPKEIIARQAMEIMFQRDRDMEARYTPYQKQKTLEDFNYHLQFIEAACESNSPAIFSNYLIWLKELLSRYGITGAQLQQSVLVMSEALKSAAPDVMTPACQTTIKAGLEALEKEHVATHSFFGQDQPRSDLAEKYLSLLLQGKRHEACDLIITEVENGMPVKDVYLHVFQTTQYQVGYLWHQGKISVAQEHFCTAATQYTIARLYPMIFKASSQGPRIVAACIGSELHEMGIRMVADFFELSGFDTYYLGANTPAEGIVQTVISSNAAVLALSVTIAYHIGELIAVIDAVRSEPACKNINILVGGYAFNSTPGLWQQVGADGFAQNAEEATKITNYMLRRAEHE